MPDDEEQGGQRGAPTVLSGHLTDIQRVTFVAFKAKVLAALAPSHERMWYEDSTLLRYLRARSWNEAKALKQLLASDAWRKANNVDQLYARFDVDDFEAARRFYPRWTGRRDKVGRPLFVYSLGAVAAPDSVSRLYSTPEDRRRLQIVALSEIGERYLFPICSSAQDQTASDGNRVGLAITCCTTIIDMEGMSFSGFWNLRNHLQTATQLSSAHHPETNYMMAMVNVPAYFAAIWAWIKGWMDAGTREKIMILSKRDMRDGLAAIVDLDNLPKAYGGHLEWSFAHDPQLDSQLSVLLGNTCSPPGPVAWEHGKVDLLGTGRAEQQSSEALNGTSAADAAP